MKFVIAAACLLAFEHVRKLPLEVLAAKNVFHDGLGTLLIKGCIVP